MNEQSRQGHRGMLFVMLLIVFAMALWGLSSVSGDFRLPRRDNEPHGLSGEHHGELNKGNISRERFAELRRMYRGDPKALQQIDVYDPQSFYNKQILKYRDALLNNDQAAMTRLEKWFAKHYPYISR